MAMINWATESWYASDGQLVNPWLVTGRSEVNGESKVEGKSQLGQLSKVGCSPIFRHSIAEE